MPTMNDCNCWQKSACETPKIETCKWSAWAAWDLSACKGCSGGGKKESTRTKSIKNLGDCDIDCEGKNRKTESCDPPKVVDCEWGEWTSWESPRGKGKCSKECGSGTMSRVRQQKAPHISIYVFSYLCIGFSTVVALKNTHECTLWEQAATLLSLLATITSTITTTVAITTIMTPQRQHVCIYTRYAFACCGICHRN